MPVAPYLTWHKALHRWVPSSQAKQPTARPYHIVCPRNFDTRWRSVEGSFESFSRLLHILKDTTIGEPRILGADSSWNTLLSSIASSRWVRLSTALLQRRPCTRPLSLACLEGGSG